MAPPWGSPVLNRPIQVKHEKTLFEPQGQEPVPCVLYMPRAQGPRHTDTITE